MFSRAKKNKTKLIDLLKGIVNTSMAAVDVATLTGAVRKSAISISELVSTTASASEEMVSTVQGIASHASNASENATKVSQEVSAAAQVMSGVHTDMEYTTECMKKLKIASEEIEEVVGSINDISDQTNLLALNAAIEAARAGEAGRGFAVVADEVRKLSTMSQSSTTQITETIQRIQKDIREVVQAVDKSQKGVKEGSDRVSILHESAEEIGNLMTSIAHSTQEQSEASQQISESIFEVSQIAEANEKETAAILGLLDQLVSVVEQQRTYLGEEDIEGKVVVLAQADHALWKKKIVDFDMGRIQLDPEDAGDHTCCRLGKWYYGEGQAKMGSIKEFKDIEAHHKAVHESAKEAILRRQEKPTCDISDLIKKLDDASSEVVSNLQALENK